MLHTRVGRGGPDNINMARVLGYGCCLGCYRKDDINTYENLVGPFIATSLPLEDDTELRDARDSQKDAYTRSRHVVGTPFNDGVDARLGQICQKSTRGGSFG